MTASLHNLNISSHYRSDRQDVVREFYVPAFEVAASYDRAVGYFSATSLALISRGLDSFIANGHKIRLVASPQLEADDIEEIRRGYEVREVFERAALRNLEAVEEQLLPGLGVLGRLIAQNQLDIKLAFVSGSRGFGIYHEKFGVIRDSSGDAVAFAGSANETHGGMVANFESIEVFRSWFQGENERVARLIVDFEELWADKTPALRVIPFPDVAAERLVSISRQHSISPAGTDSAFDPRVNDQTDSRGLLTLPMDLVLRDYQKAAVSAWFRADGHGVYKMATGTGKTKTALATATQLAQRLKTRDIRLLTVIVAPYQHLVDQWLDEVRAFGVRAIAAYESAVQWVPRARDLITALNLGAVDGAVIICTNATLAGQHLGEILRSAQQPLLLIADEVHNLGAARLHQALPQSAAYRLGLSATPERYMDEAGTQRLFEFFGDVVFELDLRRAIEMGALCRYRYVPRLIELSDDETGMYIALSNSIAALLGNGESLEDADDGPLGALLRRRSQVLGHADGKLPMFLEDLGSRTDKWFQLAYCAEGSKPSDEHDDASERQVDQVLRMVGLEKQLTVNRYVSDTPRAERRNLLRRFGAGNDLRVLVSMRCLDEGVDIPDARVAYLLASSSNPRQFVQRRGRILRPAPGKQEAEIIDYLVVPPSPNLAANPEVERRLVRREMERAAEFAALALNHGEALEILRPIKVQYKLMDL